MARKIMMVWIVLLSGLLPLSATAHRSLTGFMQTNPCPTDWHCREPTQDETQEIFSAMGWMDEACPDMMERIEAHFFNNTIFVGDSMTQATYDPSDDTYTTGNTHYTKFSDESYTINWLALNVDRFGNPTWLGETLAHEGGHHIGYGHEESSTALEECFEDGFEQGVCYATLSEWDDDPSEHCGVYQNQEERER